MLQVLDFNWAWLILIQLKSNKFEGTY
jgi:hypothetical protein